MDRIDSRALRVATYSFNFVAALSGVVCVFDIMRDSEWLARGAGRPLWEQPWYPLVVTAAMFVWVQGLAAIATGDSIRATPGDPNASVLGRAWLGSHVRVIQHGRLVMAAVLALILLLPVIGLRTTGKAPVLALLLSTGAVSVLCLGGMALHFSRAKRQFAEWAKAESAPTGARPRWQWHTKFRNAEDARFLFLSAADGGIGINTAHPRVRVYAALAIAFAVIIVLGLMMPPKGRLPQ
ncbi:MAG: hypothetical protein JNL98_32130 [Bryobacterales bacterium]|nr:hypothetical protein [Bryobacterales bacterium]